MAPFFPKVLRGCIKTAKDLFLTAKWLGRIKQPAYKPAYWTKLLQRGKIPSFFYFPLPSMKICIFSTLLP